jgi:hypothetical protein
MYYEHPHVKLSCPEDSKVWRYMDFTKYVSMLEESALWFSRADCLDDPFDSELPNSVITKMDQHWRKVLREADSSEIPDDVRRILIRQASGSRNIAKKRRLEHIVNCWHQNDHESAAMWKLYLKSDEGIAVVSTPKKLIEGVQNAPFFVLVGSVEYVDFDNYPPLTNTFQQIVRKRKSFEHERELRIVACNERNGGWCPKRFNRKGFQIRVKLPQLIDAIYVSPTAQSWFARLVRQVASRFDLTCDVRSSSLAETSMW